MCPLHEIGTEPCSGGSISLVVLPRPGEVWVTTPILHGAQGFTGGVSEEFERGLCQFLRTE